jgi:hypothetical protein
MEFNPIDMQKHLKGASHPASGEDLASVAEGNDAPREPVEKPRSFGEELSGTDDAQAAPKRS